MRISFCGGDLKVVALNYNYKHKEKQSRTDQPTLDDFEMTEINDRLDVIEWEGFMSYNATDHRGRQMCFLQLNNKKIKMPSLNISLARETPQAHHSVQLSLLTACYQKPPKMFKQFKDLGFCHLSM